MLVSVFQQSKKQKNANMEQFQQASPDLGGGRGRAKISKSFLSCDHKQRSTRLEAESLGGCICICMCICICIRMCVFLHMSAEAFSLEARRSLFMIAT